MGKDKTFIGLASAVALSAGAVFSSIGGAGADPSEKIDITICHRTGSVQHPYVMNSPATEGILEGHFGHTGPVFDAVDPPEPKWGDIIPPFGDGKAAKGLNWTDAGQAIASNGCKIPFGEVSVHKTVVDKGAVAVVGRSYSIDVTCTLDGRPILDETVSVTAGETSPAFTDVQGGAHCDAVENTAGIADLTSATSDGPVKVVKDKEVTVKITNVFDEPTVPTVPTTSTLPPTASTTTAPPTAPTTPVTASAPVAVASPPAPAPVRAQARFTG